MASAHHQLEEQGEDDDHHGSQITPLLQPSAPSSGSPEEWENSPIEQVALTVPVGDDPGTPVLTFRMWVLGTASCVALSFLNAFFRYRKEPLTITAVSAQIAVLPVGRLMATALPEGAFFRGRPWEFTLNPGPFNVKEHVLITIFANAGAGTMFDINVVTAVRIFYGQHMSFFVTLLLLLITDHAGAGVWLGWNIPAVSGGAAGDVVAVQPRPGLPLQVHFCNNGLLSNYMLQKSKPEGSQ